MSSLVSVIIPCYNQGAYLSETIQSILNQSYSNIEIIVVNDGSTDKYTIELLNQKQWPNTKIINITNSGVSNARNIGVEASNGEYILFLDGDDLIAPTYIAKALNVLENSLDIKVVSCEVGYFGKKEGVFKLPPYSLEDLLGQNLLVITSLLRKKDFVATNGFNDNMREGFEDWDFWLTFLKDGGNVIRINEVLFFYRINRRSRNGTLGLEKQDKLRRQIYKNHIELYSSHFLDPKKCFEYTNLLNSKEYKLGRLILLPVRKLILLLKL
jgi:glycosyltransferase involved in cell wall biosynthesis